MSAARGRGGASQKSDGGPGSPLLAPSSHTLSAQPQFVTPAWEEDRTRAQPVPFVRREFDVHPGMSRARLYVTALGVYEAQINGQVVGDQVLAPGWSSYLSRLLYQTFDVTNLLRQGRNALGAILGDGWYRGRLGWTGDIQVFAPAASFLYNIAGFLASWLADLAAEQGESGDSGPGGRDSWAGRRSGSLPGPGRQSTRRV